MPDERIIDPVIQAGEKKAVLVSSVDPSGDQWIQERNYKKSFYDWDSNRNVTFIGRYSSATAVSGDQDCEVTKFVYFSNQDLKLRQTLTGSWQNHSVLNWDE